MIATSCATKYKWKKKLWSVVCIFSQSIIHEVFALPDGVVVHQKERETRNHFIIENNSIVSSSSSSTALRGYKNFLLQILAIRDQFWTNFNEFY